MQLKLEASEQLLAQALAEAAVAAETVTWCESSVGRGLHEIAQTRAIDLLVIGPCCRPLAGRTFLGDDTRAALNRAPCPVAIAPSGHATTAHPLSRIGVGYDGSPESEQALEVVRTLAAERHTKLSAFGAVSVPAGLYAGLAVADGGTIDEMVDEARERIAGLQGVEPHAAYGEPAEELALYSASLDLLVIGSRNYGPLGRLVHGSTAPQLVRTSRCPLLVVARAAREARSWERLTEKPDKAAAGATA